MGIDCSGLIQNLYQMIGINLPRDTDLQAEYFSKDVDESKLKLGDLIFWREHVAMAINNKDIIHANAYHMKVYKEPLSLVKERMGKMKIEKVLVFQR